MPQLGEIKKGKEIGKGVGRGNGKYIWSACEVCRVERWVILQKGKPGGKRCKHCANVGNKYTEARRRARLGAGNPQWRGGYNLGTDGYRYIYLYPDDFFYSMTRGINHYVLEHRLVMAKHLNRCLSPWEVVHHKNGIKTDNRLENLELLPTSKFHLIDTHTKAHIKRLEKKIVQLQARIKELGGS